MADKKEKQQSFWEQYKKETSTPIYSLVLVLPLIFIYEAGVLLIDEHSWRDTSLLVNDTIQLIFHKFGAHRSTLIPACLVMITLFLLQFKSDRKWELRTSNVLLMHVEYLVYAAILFVGVAWIYEGGFSFDPPGSRKVLMAMGAGIYEEYLFRLVLLSLLFAGMEKGLKVDKTRGIYAAVLLSAVCFAGFHYVLDNDSFEWAGFFVRTAAGVFFGFLCLTRGYGTAAGTHVAFNVLRELFCR
ncbi:type II CAAX prenyl endopeptidase Rce1 family protein [Planctomycetota bacterium]